MRRLGVCVVIGFALSGCAGEQLARNTLDVTSSVGDILREQAFRNIGKQIADPATIPDQMDFHLGTIQTAYQITPSITDPFTSAITSTSAIVRNAAGGINQVTDTATKVANPKSASLSGQHSWQQSWQVIPESNTRSLLALSMLYRYVVGQIDDETLMREFPSIKPDLHARNKLRCIVCIPEGRSKSGRGPGPDFVSPRLVEARETLYWETPHGRSKRPPASATRLGVYSGVTLYSTKPTAMRDFVIMAQDLITGDDDFLKPDPKREAKKETKVVHKTSRHDTPRSATTPSGETIGVRPR